MALNPTYEDIDWKFRKELESWCYDEPQVHSQNCLEKNINVMTYFIRRSYERTYIKEDGKRVRYHENTIPFEKHFAAYRIKTSRQPLSFQALNSLLNFNELTRHLMEYKICF